MQLYRKAILGLTLAVVVSICITLSVPIYWSFIDPYAGSSSKHEQSVAIVSTVREPKNLKSWIAYHLSLGATHIYLFFDDSDDPSFNVAAAFDRKLVTPFRVTDEFRRWQWEILPGHASFELYQDHVVARQEVNTDTALHLSHKANYEWLVHIDSDELLWIINDHLGTFFSLFDSSVSVVGFRPLEVAPSGPKNNNCFTDAKTVMKTNRSRFLFYTNQKSAARVRAVTRAKGVHSFHFSRLWWQSVILQHDFQYGHVLHYPVCDFEAWRGKYKILGNFSSFWKDNKRYPVPRFHLQSREVLLRCATLLQRSPPIIYEWEEDHRDKEAGEEQVEACVKEAVALYMTHVALPPNTAAAWVREGEARYNMVVPALVIEALGQIHNFFSKN